MEVLKWDFDKHEYNIVDVPTDYDIRNCLDLEKEINCINCGKRLKAKFANSSFRWQNQACIGYNVCSDCYSEEILERYKEHIPRID